MQFQLNISLTEEDYLSFNYFHMLESIPGKKRIRKARTVFAVIMLALAALVILILGLTTFSLLYALFSGTVYRSIFVILQQKGQAEYKSAGEQLKENRETTFRSGCDF